MNAAQKFAAIYFLIALVAVLIVTFTGSGFSFEALSGYLPYVALFAFVILWEVLLYYAHFLNLYVNGFGVVTIVILCNIYLHLSLNIAVMIIIPIAAIMMAMTAAPGGGNGGNNDEQE
jgi:hypothetical protein